MTLRSSIVEVTDDPARHSSAGEENSDEIGSKARILEGIANSPGDLPNPGIKPGSPVLQADSLPSEPLGKMLLNILPLKCGR